MTNELAKELNEAGFPQGKTAYVFAHGDYIPRENLVIVTKKSEIYDAPTLSELIEACGDCISHIKKYNGNWWAVSHCGHAEHEPGGNNIEVAEPTPEEAVARLWLALNKKKV